MVLVVPKDREELLVAETGADLLPPPPRPDQNEDMIVGCAERWKDVAGDLGECAKKGETWLSRSIEVLFACSLLRVFRSLFLPTFVIRSP
jgi:hypothetical protein